MVTQSLLSKVIESYGQDAEIMFIRDRVHASTIDEGWVIHTNDSILYRGLVVVP